MELLQLQSPKAIVNDSYSSFPDDCGEQTKTKQEEHKNNICNMQKQSKSFKVQFKK